MSLATQTKSLQEFIQKNPSPEQVSQGHISDIYQDFIDTLTDHNHLYYIENQPVIADQEYDELFAYLKKIEEYFPNLISSNSPTQQLIGQISEGFQQAEHKYPLLSLENSYNAQDLLDRDEFVIKHLNKTNDTDVMLSGAKTLKPSYYVEPKFDGIAVEIIYKDGKLHQAITRGDGVVGDDITTNTKTIKNLPKTISHQPSAISLYLRGEVMMPKSVRKHLNEQREKKGETIFANTRNAASGSMKLLDSGEVAKRGLICYIYDILNPEVLGKHNTHEQLMQELKQLGLPIFPRHQHCDSMQQIVDIASNPETQQFFHAQDNDFDGLVIKVNEFHHRDILGSTQHHPRRAIAYKFPAQQASTQIESVDRQVGRTGIITPVANLTPVQLSGVTISRVSLHNIDFIRSKDIHLHDYVRVQRSGEVIPYIVGVINEKRQQVQAITIPNTCPSCQHPTSSIDMHVYCSNHACPAQLQEKLQHYVSKQCMDIEGIGESTAVLLIQQNIIKTIDQLYQLATPQKQRLLRSMPGFADKKINEISTQLQKSKQQPLRRLLHGLGIPHIGKKTAMLISQALRDSHPEGNEQYSLQNLIASLTNKELLSEIYGIGEKMIEALQAFFADQTNITIVQNLVNEGVNIDPFAYERTNNNSPFADKHFSITGTFPISRDDIVAACEVQGMIFDSSPGKQTDYIFIGEKAGSKAAKAQDLGIEIFSDRIKILQNFSFLKEFSGEKNNKPNIQSLF